MNKCLKTSVYFMLFAMFIQLVPAHVLADVNDSPSDNSSTEVLLFSAQPDEFIELFEDIDGGKVITTIPDGTLVDLVDTQEDYSQISYTETDSEKDSPEVWTGFVHTVHVINVSEADDFLEKRQDEDFILEDYPIETEPVDDSVESNEQGESDEPIEPETIEPEVDADTILDSNLPQSTPEVTTDTEEDSMSTEENKSIAEKKSNLIMPETTSVTNLQGIALKSPTRVYSKTSRNSATLKSYKQWHNLKFQSYTSNWYKATVYINGKPQTGYIHVNDVDLLKTQQKLSGFALTNTVNIYKDPTRNSGVLKSYKHGAKLIYRSYLPGWHQATVYINGKAHTGYINASDVGAEIKLKGVAVANTVSVYSKTSKNSSILKSYNKGHILTYSPFNNSWHKATVYINGKPHLGYIAANEVDDILLNQTTLKGIASQSSTHVYSSPSTATKTLKSYKQGHILQYRTFSNNWYQATVIINGKRQTGYIAKSAVENVVNKQQRQTGIAAVNSTKVYSSASTSASVIKSYSFANSLTYRTFTTNWYEATVYVNGKARTGYIHKNNVLDALNKKIVLDAGHGGSDPGSSGIGIIEKELTLDIARRTMSLLEKAGATVIMTRSTDAFVSLSDRAAIANRSNADIFVSIHGNSFNSAASGLESFWYGKYEKEKSMRLATALQNNLVKSMGMGNRGVKEGNFHVIRETKLPSSLVEVGFIDNPNDAAKLRQSKYKQLAAEGILLGILDYFK